MVSLINAQLLGSMYSGSGRVMVSNVKAYAEVAIAFASALLKGDFVGAHALLTPRARHDLPPEVLCERFFEMFRGYTDGEANSVFYDEQFALDDWPAKQPGDAGWAYVSINGENFIEGVAVTVSASEGSLLIREVEWGRP